MARQPFLPRYKGKHFCFDHRGLDSNPPAASLVGRIVAEWARVEHQMAMIMAAMLGDAPAAGVALFTTLHNARAQRDAMQAVATVVLCGDRLPLVKAMLKVYVSVGKERHNLAHGIFGWSFDIPAITLWVQSSDLASYEAESWFRFTAASPGPLKLNHDKLETLIYYYDIDSLTDILRNISVVKDLLFRFYGTIRHDYDATSEEHLRLCNEPLIAQALSEILADKKNNPLPRQ
jgi:hypothetical protein